MAVSKKTETDWHVEAAGMTAKVARALVGGVLFDLLGPKVAKKVAWHQANKPPEKRLRWFADDLPGHKSGDLVSFGIDSGRYDQLRAWCDDLPSHMGNYDLMERQAAQAAETGKPLARIEMLPSSGTLVSIAREDG